MKSNAEFDKAFREKLGHHAETPPAGMWEAIELMIPTVLAPSGRRIKWLWWSGAAVLMLMGILTIWSSRSHETLVLHFNRMEPAILNFKAPAVLITQRPLTEGPQNKRVEEFIAVKNNASPANIYSAQSNTSSFNTKQTLENQYEKPILTFESREPLDLIPSDNDADPSDISMKNTTEEPDVVSEPSVEINRPSEGSVEPIVSDPVELKKAIDPTSAKDLKRVFMPKAYFGTYYMPELTIHKGDIPKESSWSHGVGARIGIEYRGLLAESGFNISTSHDNWQYSIDYLSRDSVGWYWDVQWVNFIPLTNQYGDTIGYEPQYQVVQTAFYDSVEHHHAEVVEGSYRYYHIPLMLGVTRPVPIAKGLTYSIKGGLIYSRLFYEPDLDATFNNSSVRVLFVDDGRYYRQRSTLQWLTSVEMRYYLTAKFAVFVEPMARFYRDPYYYRPDDSDLKHPYSMSMRAGLYYRF